MYNITICIPSIRTERQADLYDSIKNSVENYSFELILVGTSIHQNLVGLPNVKFILSYSAPARCAQIGFLLSESEIITWGSDDGRFQPKALKECIDLLLSKTTKDGITIRYCEGPNFTGSCPDDSYWTGYTHADQRLIGVNPSWKIAPVGMYYTETFYKLGGFDCRFEHLNMCCHDLAYRIQKNGGQIYLSPNLVINCDQNPGTQEHAPVQNAYFINDLPLWNSLYNKENNIINIDYDNWKKAPSVWRRFK